MNTKKFNNIHNKFPFVKTEHFGPENKNYLNSCSNLPTRLVGGFVGSKSQSGSNRCSQLVWEFIFTKLEMDYHQSCSDNYFYIYNHLQKIDENTSDIRTNHLEKSTDILLDRMLNKKENKKNRPVNKINKLKENIRVSPKKKLLKNKGKMNETTFLELDQKIILCDNNNIKDFDENKMKIPDFNSSPLEKRSRRLSECSVESDDSFLIMFESNHNLYIPYRDPESDLSHDFIEFIDESDSEYEDEVDLIPQKEIIKPNQSTKRVRFADDRSLTKVHPMIKWAFAYRQARPGPWEQIARDRDRFSTKIASLSPIISPVLDSKHRDKVYKKYHSNNAEIN